MATFTERYGVSSRKIIKNLSEGRNTSCLFVLSKMRFMENVEEELLADGTVSFIQKTSRNKKRQFPYCNRNKKRKRNRRKWK